MTYDFLDVQEQLPDALGRRHGRLHVLGAQRRIRRDAQQNNGGPAKKQRKQLLHFFFFKFFVAHVRHVAAPPSVALPLQDLLQDLLFRLRALQEFSLLGHISAQHFR